MHHPALENNHRLYLKPPLPGSDSGAHAHSRDPSDKRCRCERVSLLSRGDWTPRPGADLIALREICYVWTHSSNHILSHCDSLSDLVLQPQSPNPKRQSFIFKLMTLKLFFNIMAPEVVGASRTHPARWGIIKPRL